MQKKNYNRISAIWRANTGGKQQIPVLRMPAPGEVVRFQSARVKDYWR